MNMKNGNYILLIIALICFRSNAQTSEIKKYNLYKNKFDSLSKFPISLRNDTLRLMCLDSIIESPPMVNKGKLHYEDYREIAYRSKWQKGIARYKMFYGNSIFDKKPVESVKMLMEAETELEKLKDYPSQIYTLMRLSMSLTHKTDSLSALSYIDKAIGIAKKIKSRKWLLRTLNYKANTYVYRDRVDIAIPIFEEIDKFEDIDFQNKLINDLNLGMCYINSKRVKQGMPYLTRVLATMPTDVSAYIGLHKQVRSDLINFFIDVQGDYSQAKKYFDELKSFQFDTGNSLVDKRGYFQLGYRVYKGLGDYKKSLYFLEQRNIYNDSLNAESNKNGQEGIKSQLALKEQTEKLQKAELEKLRFQNERQTQFRWILIFFSVVALLSTLYVFRTNKRLKSNNASLAQKNKEISEASLKGQTLERQRVAADLHDNLGSTLSSIKWSLQAIDKSKMDTLELEVHQNLSEMLEKAYNDVRFLSHNLLPEEFEKQGLVSSLKYFVRKINQNSIIKFELDIDENLGRFDKKIEFELYSICLELVTNILKHSKATEAKIELSHNAEQLKLIVADNGIGTFKNDSDGKGMKNVKARVESLNGEWKVIENGGIVNEIVVSL